MPSKQYKSVARIMDTDSEVENTESDNLSDIYVPDRAPQSPPRNTDAETPQPEDDISDIDAEIPRPPTPPATDTRKSAKARRKRKAVEEDDKVPTRNHTYILGILSLDDLKKPASRQEGKTISLNLGSDEPWDTFKAQLLVKIDQTLKPAKIDFGDYEVKYNIFRVLPKPGLELENEQQYQDLLQRSQGIKGKTPTINISIRQLLGQPEGSNAGAKENVEVVAGSQAAKGSKRTRRDPETLPGNVAKNKNVQLLQEQWKCTKRQATCVGVYCFPDPDSGDHLPLNHERLDCWAAAMLKEDDSATLHKPPNHKLFDMKRPALSPALQRRLDSQNQKNMPAVQASAQPVINLNVGKEIADLFRHGSTVPAPAFPPVPAPSSAPPPANYVSADCPYLLAPARSPGLDMPLGTFCASYELGNAILKRLEENCFTKSSALRFITIQDLKDMGFRLGEIAALRVAVDAWSL